MKIKDEIYGVPNRILKRWSRAGVNPFLKQCISNASSGMNLILVVGGHGPVLDFIKKQFRAHSIVTLDINPDFKPDILADLSEESLVSKIGKTFDWVVIVEVLEHISKYEEALDNVYQLLKPGGLLVGTTPWSTPLHDKPFDFFRYTSYQIEKMLKSAQFKDIKIESRGNLYDSIIYLGLRGLRTWGIKGKLLFLIFAPISLFSKRPKRSLILHDSCIGYNFSGRK